MFQYLRGGVAVAVLVLIFVIGACTPGAAPPATSLAPAGEIDSAATVRVAVSFLPKTLDPNVDSALEHFRVWHTIYDTLVTVGTDGATQPGLATSWRVVEPTVWEFKLRQGVKFHNGESFDAESVRDTIQYILNPNTRSLWAQRLNLISDIKVVDQFTVQISTRQPFALLAKNLAVAFMLPPKYLAKVGNAGFGLAPVGTGPFKFKAFQADSSAEVELFPDYWRGKAKVAGILFRQMLEASTRVAALEAGEVDIAYEVPVEQVERLRARNLGVINSPVGASYVVGLRTSVKPLDDTRVRQALNYATDAKAMNKSLLLGLSRPLDGQMVGPNATGYFSDIKGYEYDSQRAKQLLSDAGYPNGFRITFETSNGRFYKDKEIAEVVCAQWLKVGVTCDLKLLESSVWLERFVGATLGPAMHGPFQTAPQLDLEVPMVNFVGSSPRKLASIPKIDALFSEQQRAVEPDKRLPLLRALAQAIHDDPPVVFLFENVGIYGVSPKLRGAQFRADYSFDPMAVAVVK